MALSQKGAGYPYRDHIKDEWVRAAHDDHASKIQAILDQGNFGTDGVAQPPSAPAQLGISVSAGLFTVNIVHNKPPMGVRYVLQHATTPNFQAPVSEELGTTPNIPTTVQRYLPQKFYWRVAAKFPASTLTPWVYFGSPTAPILIG